MEKNYQWIVVLVFNTLLITAHSNLHKKLWKSYYKNAVGGHKDSFQLRL